MTWSAILSAAKKMKKEAVFHPESLLNIPLVRQAVEHVNKDILVPRAVDNRWVYQEVIPINIGGFNPISGKIYCGSHSTLSKWIPVAHKSARPLNATDRLVYEVLFLVHDYLHLWAYQLINKIMPQMGFGKKRVTPQNFDDFVFFHLITEAVAVVGLDYWQLCEREINEFCPIGSSIKSLAVTYSEKQLPEYRKFNPDFEAQSPEFFEQIATFYCTGEFPGFDSTDLKNSPMIYDWIRHELDYGESQRVITRQFFSQFLPGGLKFSHEQLKKPIKVNKKWQKDLIKKVGQHLWDKVKNNIDDKLEIPKSKPKRPQKQTDLGDFRFFNYNSYSGDMESLRDHLFEASADSRRYFVYQYVASFRFDQFGEEEISLIRGIVNRADLDDTFAFFSKKKRLKVHEQEPANLLILN